MSEFLRKKGFDEILVENGKISQSQITWAKMKSLETGKELVEVLLTENFVTEEHIARAIAEQYSLDFFDLDSVSLTPEVFALLPLEFIKDNSCVPLSVEQNEMKVAIWYSPDTILQDDIERISGYRAEFVISTHSAVNRKINSLFTDEKPVTLDDLTIESVLKKIDNSYNGKEQDIQIDLEGNVHTNPVVTLINKIIYSAINERASDIHIEPSGDCVKIRYRVDGDLFFKFAFSLSAMANVVARLKILADLDITEKTMPQEGRFKFRVKGEEIDFRITIIPSIQGESVSIRVLNKQIIPFEINNLGMNPEMLEEFHEIIERQYGMVLVCGVTGSGKTTTLYSMLNFLNDGTRKLVTIEDPVEYQFVDIHQIPVKINKAEPAKELTFVKGLRVVLRQDPDVIMIGEIRDHETAEIAMNASLTGHFVISSIHAQSSIDVLLRLKNLGVDLSMAGNSLNAIIAQRLVRKLCSCKIPIPEDKIALLKKDMNSSDKQYTFYSKKGCAKCANTGYYDRTGVFEILRITKEIRHMISSNALPAEIFRASFEKNGFSLNKSLIEKLYSGIIDYKEYKRHRID